MERNKRLAKCETVRPVHDCAGHRFTYLVVELAIYVGYKLVHMAQGRSCQDTLLRFACTQACRVCLQVVGRFVQITQYGFVAVCDNGLDTFDQFRRDVRKGLGPVIISHCRFSGPVIVGFLAEWYISYGRAHCCQYVGVGIFAHVVDAQDENDQAGIGFIQPVRQFAMCQYLVFEQVCAVQCGFPLVTDGIYVHTLVCELSFAVIGKLVKAQWLPTHVLPVRAVVQPVQQLVDRHRTVDSLDRRVHEPWQCAFACHFSTKHC